MNVKIWNQRVLPMYSATSSFLNTPDIRLLCDVTNMSKYCGIHRLGDGSPNVSWYPGDVEMYYSVAYRTFNVCSRNRVLDPRLHTKEWVPVDITTGQYSHKLESNHTTPQHSTSSTFGVSGSLYGINRFSQSIARPYHPQNFAPTSHQTLKQQSTSLPFSRYSSIATYYLSSFCRLNVAVVLRVRPRDLQELQQAASCNTSPRYALTAQISSCHITISSLPLKLVHSNRPLLFLHLLPASFERCVSAPRHPDTQTPTQTHYPMISP